MQNHIEDLLSAYMDHELTEDERQQVEDHLESCPHCTAMLNELMDIQNQVVTAFHSIQAPEGLEDQVINAVGVDASKQRNWLLVPLLTVLCFITIALVAAGSLLFKFVSVGFRVFYYLIIALGSILGSNPYTIAGLIGFSILLIVVSSISLNHLFKTKSI